MRTVYGLLIIALIGTGVFYYFKTPHTAGKICWELSPSKCKTATK